jgi:uncharacterized protein YndB with AHSA1/START domain
MTREFDAPRQLLFRAYTDPDQIQKWWGPSYLTTTVDQMDVRVGGAWRFIQRDSEGNEYAFSGVYQEIVEPERLVYTFEFEGLPEPGHYLTEAITLAELPDGKTRLSSISMYQTIEDLEGMVASGMESGAVESTERLAALVENDAQAGHQPTGPYPGLQQLNKLVGGWKVSGPEIDGWITYEWMEGGFFLVQHFDLVHDGHPVKGLEIIGYERGFGAEEPGQDLTSHSFDNLGNTFNYSYEVDDDTLTIWGGPKGSPAFYRGKWSEDGNTNAGRWEWPGGGYESTMTRIK